MLKDLIQKIIIVLSLEYLVFFAAEVVLPGVISSAFNINILLVAVLLLMGALLAIGKDGKVEEREVNYTKWFVVLGVFVLLISIIALYKVSIVMMIVYTVVIMIVVKLLWKNL